MAELIPVHAVYNGTIPLHFFRTSDVYGITGGIGSKVGIKKVDPATLTGTEEIVSVKELLRTGILQRISIRYKDSAGKRKSSKVLVRNTFLSKVFGDVPAEKLDNMPYSIGGTPKGNIISIGGLRRASDS